MPIETFNGKLPDIHPSVFVASTAAVIGDVKIGADSSVWYGVVIRGDVNDIVIGERTNIQDNAVLHVAAEGQGCYLGSDVLVGHLALVHACTVEDNAFIGMQACVMDGARVESNAMVAAGALVTPGKVVPAGELWAGRPARKIRDLSAEELARSRRGTKGYVDLGHVYRDRE